MVQHLSNGLYVLFAFVLGIDEDVIKVYYDKNVELLYQNLVDIVLECGRYVGQFKRHDLIFKVTIVGSEDHLPFIAFPDLHLMVDISQIELDKILSPT